MKRRRVHAAALLLALMGISACGAQEDTDDRELFTKAPLEELGLTIENEPDFEMTGVGTPNLLVTQETPNFIAVPEARAAQPATGSAGQQPAGQQPSPQREDSPSRKAAPPR